MSVCLFILLYGFLFRGILAQFCSSLFDRTPNRRLYFISPRLFKNGGKACIFALWLGFYSTLLWKLIYGIIRVAWRIFSHFWRQKQKQASKVLFFHGALESSWEPSGENSNNNNQGRTRKKEEKGSLSERGHWMRIPRSSSSLSWSILWGPLYSASCYLFGAFCSYCSGM